MRILPRNHQCKNSRRRTWGGWAASEFRLCAHLRLRKHNRPHRQKGPGARSDSRQLTRPTGEQEAAWNRRHRDQIADCCPCPALRCHWDSIYQALLTSAGTLTKGLHNSPSREVRSEEQTEAPPQAYAHLLTKRTTRSLHHWVLLHNMYFEPRKVAIFAFPFSFCFLSYFLVGCGFIINSSM